jgi:hypothetical protein
MISTEQGDLPKHLHARPEYFGPGVEIQVVDRPWLVALGLCRNTN